MAQEKSVQFAYIKKANIPSKIAQKEIDQYDMVICKDTHELVFLDANCNQIPLQSRVYTFSSLSEADTAVKADTFHYEGEIVQIGNDNKYIPFIVSKNSDGTLEVVEENSIITSFNNEFLKKVKVDSLPLTDIKNNTIYLIPRTYAKTNKKYDMYMYVDSAWELIGSDEYELPIASTTVLGGVKIDGTSILEDENGVISISAEYIRTLIHEEIIPLEEKDITDLF